MKYELYIDGQFYGSANKPEYMTELFDDYVVSMDMYDHEKVEFTVIKKEDEE